MRLVDVYDETDRHAYLYDLLDQREPHENISHRTMPSWAEHVAFVDLDPYEAWFFIMDGAERVGAIYLTKQREVGIFLWPEYQGKGYGAWALKELGARYPGPLLANIAPTNERSAAFFARQGFELVQHTYRLS
jgi:RimJ/RimL family protein N-acetyltransferase